MKINLEKVDCEDFGSEIVFIEIKSGSYFTVKGLATEAIRPLMAGCQRTDYEAWLKSQFESGEQQKIQSILAYLEQHDLLVEASPKSVPLPLVRTELEPTTFKVFDDVQDIIKLDPLHEVQDSGWPDAKTEKDLDRDR